MPGQIIAKLLELAVNEARSEVDGWDIEARLHERILGKSLEFSPQSTKGGEIRVHSIGRGRDDSSTVVTLQVIGVPFERDSVDMSLDFRYIFYREFGHSFMFHGTATKFLIASPTVQKLGSENILIDFAIYGDTVYQATRTLGMFAQVVRSYFDEPHSSAIDEYEGHDGQWDLGEEELEIQIPQGRTDSGNPYEIIRDRANQKQYIKDYIKYRESREFRSTIDNRNTLASP